MSIRFEKVTHIYEATPKDVVALNDLDLLINDNVITAIVGETGSGKSTLVQHLNGLLLPTKGTLSINDIVIQDNEKPNNLKELRRSVGLVFQFPEYQLFEETILKDVMFGPKNFGFSEEESLENAKDALKKVNIDESLYEKSPLELSGGQKRRVAIAGILAMKPKVIVLDEPTAGLDPQGAKEMMELFSSLNTTLIIVTHDMNHVLEYADYVVVVSNGKIIKNTDKISFFNDTKILNELNIEKPEIIKTKELLINNNININSNTISIEELVNDILRGIK